MPEPDPEADAERDALRTMRAHLDDAHAAADRLVQEAQRQAEAESDPAASAQVPPRGWEPIRPRGERGPDLQALLALLDAVRDSVPGEVTRPLAQALRELLLALRALIDWYLERLGEAPAPAPPPPVEDIPLD